MLCIVLCSKTDFFTIPPSRLRETYNPRICKTIDFKHIVLILYFERPFKWCSWFSKILIFFWLLSKPTI